MFTIGYQIEPICRVFFKWTPPDSTLVVVSFFFFADTRKFPVCGNVANDILNINQDSPLDSTNELGYTHIKPNWGNIQVQKNHPVTTWIYSCRRHPDPAGKFAAVVRPIAIGVEPQTWLAFSRSGRTYSWTWEAVPGIRCIVGMETIALQTHRERRGLPSTKRLYVGSPAPHSRSARLAVSLPFFAGAVTLLPGTVWVTR